ncbi:scavenger receptor class B member 1 [Manduca sexta]|uniref:Scavenger receptor class B member 1 n=1 Tax=Manduca sexta TaxID=7130 RepID=A0A921YYG9_MANSE|nr:scavenger receptor class B member 1 [Manduca sexta]KAG6448200.1 hypothetical protein O3G_MSEX005349 [Manduca sexta]KAG6448201.1 hypothetical protein O3G_MSEX005349 [Manduca sexta]
MVVGAKIALQHVPSKGRISLMKIQNFTVIKRQSIAKAVYGFLMVGAAVLMIFINPLELITNWYLDIKEGSFLFRMWEKPSYEIYSEVWLYNYTNVPEYLSGESKVLKLNEVGPFTFQEVRTNENVTVDKDRGVLTMKPRTVLNFLPELSMAELTDATVTAPNIALVAVSSLAAEKLGYFANAGAYYSLSALGVKLFRNFTAEDILWGYEEPIVSIANNLFPGWIDFGKLGILDRFYAQRSEFVEVDIGNASNRFSLREWNGSPGIPEQGFTDLNSSIPCNVIKGTYEGFMLPPNFPRGKNIPIFRRQACRVYPFDYSGEFAGDNGFNYYRYILAKSSFSRSSQYACSCSHNCMPEGFVDVSNCYYGFPIALSKPHFLDADPVQRAYYEGLHPDPEKHSSHLDVEPTIGVPLTLHSKIQVNIAVRTSPGNPIINPLKDKVLPILWLSMYCDHTPPEVITLLRLRLVIGPPLIITIEVVLFITGLCLGIHGFYRVWKPNYHFGEVNRRSVERTVDRKNVDRSVLLNIAENTAFSDDDTAKESVSLLTMEVDEAETPDIVVGD